MLDILLVLVGAAAGGIGVWLWLNRQMRDQLQAELAEAARKSARAVDWAKSELAMKLDRRDQEIATLRAQIDERDHSVEQVRSRLQADLALVQRERGQWETRTTEVSRRAEALSAQVRDATSESLRDLERLRAIAHSLERVAADYAGALDAMDTRLRRGAGHDKEGIAARPGAGADARSDAGPATRPDPVPAPRLSGPAPTGMQAKPPLRRLRSD